jgi:hypothetical protein
MATPDDRAGLTAQDRLIDLLVQHDEASRVQDWPRVATLRTQIDDAKTSLAEPPASK